MLEKIKKVANYYKFSRQSRQLTEECAELIQAVNKYHRYRESLNTRDEILLSAEDNGLLIQDIVEEIADVEIMLEQMKHLLNIDTGAVEIIKVNKVTRQLERIEKEMEK